jgi:hypothetical protein
VVGDGDADAGVQVDIPTTVTVTAASPSEPVRLSQRGAHPLRHGSDELRVVLVDEQQCELVTLEVRRGVRRTDAGAQASSDEGEELVTGTITEAVVHRLEAVEVDEQDGDAPGWPTEGAVDAGEQLGPARQTRERIELAKRRRGIDGQRSEGKTEDEAERLERRPVRCVQTGAPAVHHDESAVTTRAGHRLGGEVQLATVPNGRVAPEGGRHDGRRLLPSSPCDRGDLTFAADVRDGIGIEGVGGDRHHGGDLLVGDIGTSEVVQQLGQDATAQREVLRRRTSRAHLVPYATIPECRRDN